MCTAFQRGREVLFCEKCGKKADADARFCSKCGTPIRSRQNENDAFAVSTVLANMFFETCKDRALIKELKADLSLAAQEKDILMSLFWLFFLAFSRAVHSSEGKFSTQQYQLISDLLASIVSERSSAILGKKDSTEDLLASSADCYKSLYVSYTSNADRPPSVHYWIGKEMCRILNGDAVPNPALVLWFGERFHKDTVRIKLYLDGLN